LLLVALTLMVQGTLGKLNLCDVETGQTNIILDIEESRGDRKYSLSRKHSPCLGSKKSIK
jgi:hypothetical protein